MKLRQALRIGPREVVALTGAGGKTTLMFNLARELETEGRRVVTTMTTKIFVAQMARAPARLVLQGEGALLSQLPQLLAEHGHVLIAGGTAVEQDKVQGVAPELIDRVAAQHGVDAVIVEADGSRRLPFKAPAEHEPVVPSTTTLLVPLVGLDILGRPLAAENVHRPELVAALAGAELGEPVTPEMIAKVVAHPKGGAKGLPEGARLVPFLNQAEGPERLEAARRIARLLLADPVVDEVVIGSAQADDPVLEVWGRVAGVVLAAGEARRFGSLKQVMPWHGRPLVAHVVEQALRCPDIDRLAVTLGAGSDRVAAAIAGLEDFARHHARSRDRLASRPKPERGVRAGCCARAGRPPQRGALRAGGSAGDFAGVAYGAGGEVSRHAGSRRRARHEGQRGNPVLFDRSVFREFAGLRGDVGGRPVLKAHADEMAWVDWPSAEILRDIDTAEDYAAGLGA